MFNIRVYKKDIQLQMFTVGRIQKQKQQPQTKQKLINQANKKQSGVEERKHYFGMTESWTGRSTLAILLEPFDCQTPPGEKAST